MHKHALRDRCRARFWLLAGFVIAGTMLSGFSQQGRNNMEVLDLPGGDVDGSGIPVLSAGTVSPASGYNGTTWFTFSVVMSDIDNVTPAWVNMTINGTIHSMERADASDLDHGDGCTYVFGTTLAVPGTYEYAFDASNGTHSPATHGPFTGPVVMARDVYFADHFEGNGSGWAGATGLWHETNRSDAILEDFEEYSTGAFTSTGHWSITGAVVGSAIVGGESKALRLAEVPTAGSVTASYNVSSPSPSLLSGEWIQFDWTPGLSTTSNWHYLFHAWEGSDPQRRISVSYDPRYASTMYTLRPVRFGGTEFTSITAWYDGRTGQNVGQDILQPYQKHAIRIELVSSTHCRYWVHRYSDDRWFHSDLESNWYPFTGAAGLSRFGMTIQTSLAGGYMLYDNFQASWLAPRLPNHAAWFGNATTGTLENTLVPPGPLVDDFNSVGEGASIRDVNTTIGRWNAWTEGAGFSYTKVTRGGKSWGRMVDSSGSAFGVSMTFSASKTWTAGDFFEFTYERVGGTGWYSWPSFCIGRAGVGHVFEMYSHYASATVSDELYVFPGTAGSATLFASGLDRGANLTVRIAYATDTSCTLTVRENGVLQATQAFTNRQNRPWSSNPIDYFQMATGGVQTNDIYITDLVASWIRTDSLPVNGTIISTAFSLPSDTPVELGFDQWRAGDGTCDVSRVLMSTDGGTDWVEVFNDTRGLVLAWERVRVDLSSFAGNESVQLAFSFDSVDGLANHYPGWFVDNILVARALAPVLEAVGVNPGSGNQSTTFTFSATYRHPLNAPPGFMNVVINGTSHSMTSSVETVPVVEDFQSLHEGDIHNQPGLIGTWFREGSTAAQVNATVVDVGGDKYLQSRDISTSYFVHVYLSFAKRASAEDGLAVVRWTQDKLDSVGSAVAIRQDTSANRQAQVGFLIDGGIRKVMYVNRTGSYVDTGLTWELNTDETWEMRVVDRDSMMIRKIGGAWAGPFQTWRQFSTGDVIDNVQFVGGQTINPNFDIKNVSCSWMTASADDYAAGVVYNASFLLQPGAYEHFFECGDGTFSTTSPVVAGPTVLHTNDHDPVLSGGMVVPGTGFENSTIFTFSVTYTDADNNAPAWVNVTINGSVHAMAKQDPLDIDYMDGCTYVYTTTLPGGGVFEHAFDASDGARVAATLGPVPGPDIRTFNDAVDNYVLDFTHGGVATWYGQIESSWDGVDAVRSGPITHAQQSWFRATVSGAGRILFYSRVSSQSGSDYLFFLVNGTLNSIRSGEGAWAQFSYVLAGSGPHLLEWRYQKDASGSAGSDCAWVDFIEWVPVYPPALENGAVDPSSGFQDTAFNFTVSYVDADNDAPVYVRLVVNGTAHAMQKVHASDVDYTDGCEYTVLVYLQPGMHEYRFETSDGVFTNVTQTVTDLVVGETNDHDPVLSVGQVSPGTGTSSTLFTFSVTYTDADNNAPVWVNVTINGSVHAMAKQVPGDMNFMDGCVYVYSTTLATGGTHAYSFDASDGSRLAGTLGPFTGPVVLTFNEAVDNHLLVFTHGGNAPWYPQTAVSWDAVDAVRSGAITHNQQSWFQTTVTGRGIIRFYWRVSSETSFDYLSFRLNGTVLQQRSGEGAWALYEYTITGTGTHTLRWQYSKDGSLSSGSDCGWVDHIEWVPHTAPALVGGGVTPGSGNQLTPFNFTVSYVDADNDAPVYVRLVVNGTAREMQKVHASDVDYTDGCEYTVLVYLQPGTHEYRFETSDGVFTNVTQTVTGPSVIETNDHDPLLSNGQVSPGTGHAGITTFTYSVNYTDADNNAPSWVNVTINGSVHAMSKLDPLDTNYTDGCVYVFSTTLAAPGTYGFSFDASDGSRLAATLGPASGPVVAVPTFVNHFIDDFEGDMSKWSSITGLWHRTSTSSAWPDPCHSPTRAMWFGQESTGTYATGSTVTGDLISVSFDLSGVSVAYLEFYHWLRSEGLSYDWATVFISTNGGGLWTQLLRTNVNIDPWQFVSINISAYCGYPSVRLRFNFDSIDNYANDFRGWLVDDVRVFSNTTVNTAAPGLFGGSVSPSGGSQLTPFNFSVTYLDVDDNSPAWVAVVINGTGYPMGKVDPMDVVYADGCEYFAIVYLVPGVYEYYFQASDGFFTNTTTTSTGLSVIETNDHDPVLSAGGVTPGSGYTGTTTFTFSVTYTDADNNAPAWVNVTINGSVHAMSKLDPLDTNFTDGCVYVFSTTLAAPGTFAFSFDALDGSRPAATVGPLPGPAVLAIPYFDGMYAHYDFTYLGIDAYLNNTYHHLHDWVFRNDRDCMFTAEPSYHDVDLATREIDNSTGLWADGTHTPLWIPLNVSIGTLVPISLTGLDHQFIVSGATAFELDGVLYDAWFLEDTVDSGFAWYEMSTGLLLHGTFHLTMASLIFNLTLVDTNVGIQPVGVFLENGGVVPPVGASSTAYDFRVTYVNHDGVAPDNVSLDLDGTFYLMSKLDPLDNDYTDGVIYRHVNVSMDVSSHAHRFIAMVGGDSFNFPFDGSWLAGPDVLPFNFSMLRDGSNSPAYGDTDAVFTFSVVYQDTQNNSPAWVNLVLDGTSYPMVKDPADDDFSNGVLYTLLNGTMTIGSHVHHFEAWNGTNLVRFPSAGSMPPVNVIQRYFPSSYSETVPVIDGVMNAGEWAGAMYHVCTMVLYDAMSGYTTPVRTITLHVWIMNDNETLRIAIVVEGETRTLTGNGDMLGLLFDGDGNGALNDGDHAWLISTSSALPYFSVHDCHYTASSYMVDSNAGGTEDGASAYTHSNPVEGGLGNYTFEIAMPLSSGDPLDLQASMGDALRFKVLFVDYAVFGIGVAPYFDSVVEYMNIATFGIMNLGIDIMPPTSTHPADITTWENATDVEITWHLFTAYEPGEYRVMRNGSVMVDWTAWPGNGTAIVVPVDTDAGTGTWIYTIEFHDNNSAGIPDAVVVLVNDRPILSGGTAVNNTAIPRNATGVTIDWSIEDTFDGTGTYRVLVNGVIYIDWVAWTSGVPLDVSVDTGRGFGTWNYTIQYRDGYMLHGTPGTVLVTVHDVPGANQPGDMLVVNGTVATIGWVLVDATGPGQYLVLLNGSVHVPWTGWSNNTSLDVPVLTSSGLGTFNYTILYNNTNGYDGTPSTVLVVVNDVPLALTSPPAALLVQQDTTVSLGWTLIDGLATGNYTVLLDGTPVTSNQPWVNATPVVVPVVTGAGCGVFNYTLIFWDAQGTFGAQGVVLVTVDDTPVVLGKSPDGVTIENTAGVSVNWTLGDSSGGGTCTVLLNGTVLPGHDGQAWTSGVPVVVGVNTTWGLGLLNYTIVYNDTNGFDGMASTILIWVNDIPVATVSPPGSLLVQQNATVLLNWTLTDRFGPGSYTVLLDGTPVTSNQPWVNATPVVVPVDTGAGCGVFNYTLIFWDAQGTFGAQGVVLVTVDDTPVVLGKSPDGVTIENTAGVSVNWTLGDSSGGGTCTVLLNGTVLPGHDGQAWTSGVPVVVGVNTTWGLGLLNYTIVYNDTNGFDGMASTILIWVNDIPVVMSRPANHTSVLQNATATLEWILGDRFAPGEYLVMRNGTAVPGHVLEPWMNGSTITVDVDTGSGCGWFEYVIVFWDAQYTPGVPESILIWIEDIPVVISSSPDGVVLQDAPGVVVSWTIEDLTGSGNYTVRCNGVPVAGHVNATWTSGVPVIVPVATGTIGSFTYDIAFHDVMGFPGVNWTIGMVVNDLPVVSWATVNGTFVVQNGTAQVSWVLVDGLGAGSYTVTCNGAPVAGHVNQPWVNVTSINVAVATNAGCGTRLYRITFTDAHGTSGVPSTVSIDVEDIPGVLQAPVVSMLMENATPAVLAWLLVDMTGGGAYTALVNGVPVATGVAWSNGTSITVNVPLSNPGAMNVTLRYEDLRGVAGPQSVVLFTVNDYPRVVEAQPAIRIMRYWPDVLLSWTMEDTVGGGGVCRLYRDGQLLATNVAWVSGQPRVFHLNNTNLAPGNYTFMVRYWDAHGAEGPAVHVVVTVYEDANPFLTFIEENMLLVLGSGIGLVVVVVVSAAVARRKGGEKVAKAKAGKAQKGEVYQKKTLPDVPGPGFGTTWPASAATTPVGATRTVDEPRGWDIASAGGVAGEMAPAGQGAGQSPVPASVGPNLMCLACTTEFTVDRADPGTAYACPSCNQTLARLSRCPSCQKRLALKQEDFVRYQGSTVACPFCKQPFKV